MDLYDLAAKPIKEQFTKEEMDFIKTKVKKGSYEVYYAIYSKESKKGKNIAFIIDSDPRRKRRSSSLNIFDIICRRQLCDIEYDEKIANWGSNNRTMEIWYYKTIEKLIEADSRYELETPQKFIDHCKSLGYSDGKKPLPKQTKLNL